MEQLDRLAFGASDIFRCLMSCLECMEWKAGKGIRQLWIHKDTSSMLNTHTWAAKSLYGPRTMVANINDPALHKAIRLV